MEEEKGSFGKLDHFTLLLIDEKSNEIKLCEKCEKNKSKLDCFSACCHEKLINHFKSDGWFNDVFMILNKRLFNTNEKTSLFMFRDQPYVSLVFHPDENAFYICNKTTQTNNIIDTPENLYHFQRNKLDFNVKKYKRLNAENLLNFMGELTKSIKLYINKLKKK